jgi:hypothetical protein
VIVDYPNFFAPISGKDGLISDAWWRRLQQQRNQLNTGFYVIGSVGLQVDGSPIAPGDTLTLTNTGVTSLRLNQPSAGIVISNTGVPQTLGVTSTFALANDLAAVEELSTFGLATRTALDTWETRTNIGTANRITVTNGDGVSGNPIFDIASTYIGQTSITTLGAITTVTSIASPDFIQFDTTAVIPSAVGQLAWNNADGTLDLGLKGGNVTLQIGQEIVLLARNDTGALLSNGQIVYVTGATGNRATIALADASASGTAHTTIGMLTEDVPNGQQGFVTVIGLVRDLDTSAFAEGTRVWLSTTPGGLTSAPPVGPNSKVSVGYVVRSHATVGSFFVKVEIGIAVEEIDDIVLTGLANNDLLMYNSGTLNWTNRSTSTAINLLVPTQAGNAGEFLTTNGTVVSWAPVTSGTVTSVSGSGGTTGLTLTGGPITTSGTLTLGGTLAVANGGTGVTTSTGTGSVVLSNTPTLVTPVIGAATGTSVNLTSTATASAFIPTGASIPTNGLYLLGAGTPGLSANSTLVLSSTSTLATLATDLALSRASNTTVRRTDVTGYLGISGGSAVNTGMNWILGGQTTSAFAGLAHLRYDSTNLLTATSAGLIGINKTPSEVLDVTTSTSRAHFYLETTLAGQSAAIRLTSTAGSGQWAMAVGTGSTNNLAFSSTAGGELMRLTSANVVTVAGNLLANGATSVLGYGTGSGGTVTQATSKATGVTLNKSNGQIVMNAAALAANTSVAFTLTNSTIAATDVVCVTIASGATSLAYITQVQATAAGSCSIALRNISAGSLSQAVALNFAVLKSVTS